jgi:hypothetical protein
MEVHSSNGQRGATLIALAAIIADVCHLVRDDQTSATLPRRSGAADSTAPGRLADQASHKYRSPPDCAKEYRPPLLVTFIRPRSRI